MACTYGWILGACFVSVVLLQWASWEIRHPPKPRARQRWRWRQGRPAAANLEEGAANEPLMGVKVENVEGRIESKACVTVAAGA